MIQKSSVLYPAIKSTFKSLNPYSHSIIVEPLLPGFGHTLGNSIRRVLLSTVPGSAITKIRINNITHEYQAIDSVLEDALNVILNLKLLRSKILVDDDSVVISLKKNKAGDVKAGDFNTEKRVEIVNPDLYICHLGKDTELNIEVEISKGVGYLASEKINFAGNLNPQDILVDALFSPVSNASLNVEKVRVGDRTDFDKLTVNFETDGTQSGEDVAEFVFDFVGGLFDQIKSGLFSPESVESLSTDKKSVKSVKKSESQIKLADDIVAILEKNGILTDQDLTNAASEVSDFAGITKKMSKDIKEYIESLS
jgi:DNA-directed RNA polymerase subunit alpha